ncbi:8-oxo-dGTP diphosphatase MutT [archaeon SCG-AAA382B04]|nr:8-oxo-dGTP diphosphatase MutT [archaeon SCG-AAA382B04]
MIEVVAGIVFDGDKNVLLAQRTYPKPLKGRWEFPGGKIQENEPPCGALMRELKEELNIQVCDINEKFKLRHIYYFADIQFIVFTSKLVNSKEEIIVNEHGKLEWVKPNKLDSYELTPADKKIAKRYF